MGTAAGGTLKDTDLARITASETRITALETPTLIVLRATVAGSIPNATWTPIPLDFEETDTGNWHSTSINTSRVQPPAGWYHVDAIGTFAANNTGLRAARLTINGTFVPGRSNWLPPNGVSQTTTVPISGPVRLNGVDYLECQVFQSSGIALNTAIDVGPAPFLALRKISN